MPLSPHLALGARWTFVGGKGGVGKTTVAAALAVELAESGENVTLLSTDPAHSLGDALGVELSGEPLPVTGIHRLRAFELDVAGEEAAFLEAGGDAIAVLIERGTYLELEDVRSVTNLALPGIDELAAVLRLGKLSREADGRIIVDTAPTGHTLRLLDLPATGLGWLEALEAMQGNADAVAAAFARRAPEPDRESRFLAALRTDLESLLHALRDPAETRFVLVANPEDAVLAETERYREELTRRGIAIGGLVMNRVVKLAAAGRRSAYQNDPDVAVRRLDLPDHPLEALHEFAAAAMAGSISAGAMPLPSAAVPLSSAAADALSASTEAAAPSTSDGVTAAPFSSTRAAARGEIITTAAAGVGSSTRIAVGGAFHPPDDRRLYFVGGKGGVGKTTVAAATAAWLSGVREGTVLLLSVDPAGSLSEILDEPVGATAQPLRALPRVHAQQVDAASTWSGFTRRYRDDFETLLDGMGAEGAQSGVDREMLSRLGDLAPPGIDELVAVSEVIDLLEDGQYDAVVVDTSPTGHFLRLLEMPDVAQQWTRAMLRLLLKYRSVVRLAGAGERVLELSRSLRTLRERLADPSFTWFAVVALPESLSIPEAARLIRSMKRLGNSPASLIVNRMLDESGGATSVTERAARALLAIDPALPAAGAPIMVPGPTGRAALESFVEQWRAIRLAPG